ncbi:MAG: sodium-dependent transporter, partial [Acidobacteriota bacterium]|nr:sodium-dependent transporter [Acidobacteriota bacterium]
GAFVLVYLVFVVLIGIPVILAELSIGRASQKNPVGAFRALAPGSAWPVVGLLGVTCAFAILAFYSVVAGWTLGYLYESLTGGLSGVTTAEKSEALFSGMIGSPLLPIGLTAAFMLLTVVVVRGGVSGGIERASKILMPVFFVLLVVLAVRSMTLPGGSEGLGFLFGFDWSKITVKVVISALGQALFSLSLGLGAMITYGSYLPRRENLWTSGATVAFFDTSIALLAGVIIFPALFAAGGDPAAGPGLVFVTMPTVFNALPGSTLVGVAFYSLLVIAALTSTISLLEVVVSYFIDERGWGRGAATWTLGSLCFLLAVPSALSQGAFASLSRDGLLGRDFLDVQNIVFGNYALSIGALFICLFVGWRWGIAAAAREIEHGGHLFSMKKAWSVLVRFVCPLAVLTILGFIIYTQDYF